MKKEGEWIWLIDDDAALRELVGHILETAGYQVSAFASGPEALSETGGPPDAVLLDLMMPKMDGTQVLSELKRRWPDLSVVILTAINDIQKAVEVTKLGAYDYLVKPVDDDRLLTTLGHAVSHRRLEREVERLRGELGDRYHVRNIIGSSVPMCRIYEQIEKVLESDISVFISGESGTGKELVAKAIHYGSQRAGAPFVDVNCAAIPESLQESELFGHEKGAFTGAIAAHPGKFEQAQKGTILLDEVGEMAPSSQARLLRVLQERCLQRIGGTRRIDLDVRVISASNKDLAEMVRDGSFRRDLYYRLVVFPIHLPPLRERPEDVPLLVEHFIAKHGSDARRRVERVSGAAMERLSRYSWPGNVRELENVIHRSLLVASGVEIKPEDLPPELGGSNVREPDDAAGSFLTLEEMEGRTIRRVVKACGGNLSEVARRLGIGRSTLYRKLDQFGIPRK
ncbi:MAG: sigma-54 dependent transcriptional regulator [Acidobacteria bacterium]|jgi:DNA-binding NtrC family response regulator|nr:sigma-54 dependent transcriptional regulator [Acidobacteriota bacterium]